MVFVLSQMKGRRFPVWSGYFLQEIVSAGAFRKGRSGFFLQKCYISREQSQPYWSKRSSSRESITFLPFTIQHSFSPLIGIISSKKGLMRPRARVLRWLTVEYFCCITYWINYLSMLNSEFIKDKFFDKYII